MPYVNWSKNKIIALSKKHQARSFSEKIGIDQSKISHIENERTQPTYEDLLKIAPFFQIPVTVFYADSIQINQSNTQHDNSIGIYVSQNNQLEQLVAEYKNIIAEYKERVAQQNEKIKRRDEKIEELKAQLKNKK